MQSNDFPIVPRANKATIHDNNVDSICLHFVQCLLHKLRNSLMHIWTIYGVMGTQSVNFKLTMYTHTLADL